HGALFENYPSLAELEIVWREDLPENVNGGYDRAMNAIHLNDTRSPEAIRSTLLHELQHAVQIIEGFARGGSPHDKAFISAAAAMGVDVNDQEALAATYRRLLGEIEARDVQARAHLTAEELRERPPYVSQGIPESEFIVRQQRGGFAAEVGPPLKGRPPPQTNQKPGPAGLSVSGIRETLIARFGGGVRRLMYAGTLQIVQSEHDLPGHLNDGKGGIRGVYDPKTDTIWMVADNLTAADAPRVFLHELGVHYGLERMVGSDKYQDIIRQIKAMERLGNEAVRASRAAIPSDTPAAAVDDELVAYLVEKHPELPLVKRILAAIRAFLFRKGLIKNIRPEDVVALARAAARHAARGAVMNRAGSARSQAPAYSGSPLFSRVQVGGDVFGPYSDLEDLRRKVRDYAQREYVLRPKIETVRSTKEQVIIPWQGVKHTIATAFDDATLRTVAVLPEIIRNARYLRTEKDRELRPNIKAIHHYEASAAIDDKNYRIFLAVREHLDGKRFYDHFAVEETKEPAGSGERQAQGPDESLQPAAGSEFTIVGNGGPVKGPEGPLYS
ncbi:MAG: DUF6782 family putative metallopeptidase, partial [Gammaproteobacteria bacterium]